MTVGFDAKRLFQNFTGLGNYSRFVVQALRQFFPDDKYVLYSPHVRDHPETRQFLHDSQITTIVPAGPSRFTGALWRRWLMSAHATMKELDIYHGLSQELPFGMASRIRKVVTVHDLIFVRFPDLYNPVDVALYKAKLRHACASADSVIAISNQTANDLVDFMGVDASKIRVVYQGCHPSFKNVCNQEVRDHVKARYALPDQYILYVGTIEKRKNLVLLVKALANLEPPDRLPVVVIGKATAYMKEVLETATTLKVADYFHFRHDALFTDLPAIYQQASVFVYPSVFEGFGIPIVEAIESRVPVIACKGSCLEEAGGPDSVYVDPMDPTDLATQLKGVLFNENRRRMMVFGSLSYVSQFSPEVVARKINEMYRQLL